jgi:hypothetical protein
MFFDAGNVAFRFGASAAGPMVCSGKPDVNMSTRIP